MGQRHLLHVLVFLAFLPNKRTRGGNGLAVALAMLVLLVGVDKGPGLQSLEISLRCTVVLGAVGLAAMSAGLGAAGSGSASLVAKLGGATDLGASSGAASRPVDGSSAGSWATCLAPSMLGEMAPRPWGMDSKLAGIEFKVGFTRLISSSLMVARGSLN